MLKILILINLVVALAGVGVVFYSHNMMKPEPTDQDLEKSRMRESLQGQSNITPVPLTKLTVNLLSGPNRLRFLNLEMNIVPFFEDQKKTIKDNEYLIKNVVIELASTLTPEEVETVTGKMLFESRTKKQINTKLGQPVIKQIFFSKFVIQ